MGLLDDLLGGLAGQMMGGGSPQPPTRQAAGGASGSAVLTALMPVVLAMLSGSAPRGGGGQTGGGGGLGGILGQVLGGAGGGGGSTGGLADILGQLQRAGFGEQADSWVGRGTNKPISPDAMSQVFGQGGLEQIARQAGLSTEDASRGLSALLPEVIDRVTPNGAVPDADSLTRSLAELARRLGGR